MHFEIEKNTSRLGLLERVSTGEYLYIEDKNVLEQHKLYYLYYKEKPDKVVSNATEEDSKRVLIINSINSLQSLSPTKSI